MHSLLRQNAEQVVLTIPNSYERFPDWDCKLPDLPKGVSLIRSPDLGPATKFFSAYAMFPDKDVLIADDDCHYSTGWLPALLEKRANSPEAIIAASTFDAARLGVKCGTIAQGFAGILLRPKWLGTLGTPDHSERWVDDIWLAAQIAITGRDIISCPEARSLVTPQNANNQLQDTKINGRSRAELNRYVSHRLSSKLGIWRDRPSARS